jgi:hypothetical protein
MACKYKETVPMPSEQDKRPKPHAADARTSQEPNETISDKELKLFKHLMRAQYKTMCRRVNTSLSVEGLSTKCLDTIAEEMRTSKLHYHRKIGELKSVTASKDKETQRFGHLLDLLDRQLRSTPGNLAKELLFQRRIWQDMAKRCKAWEKECRSRWATLATVGFLLIDWEETFEPTGVKAMFLDFLSPALVAEMEDGGDMRSAWRAEAQRKATDCGGRGRGRGRGATGRSQSAAGRSQQK